MSKIRQVAPNLWQAPENFGVTPQFMRTEHAMAHYPNGEALLHESLHKEVKTPLIARSEEIEDLDDVFEYSSADGDDVVVELTSWLGLGRCVALA